MNTASISLEEYCSAEVAIELGSLGSCPFHSSCSLTSQLSARPLLFVIILNKLHNARSPWKVCSCSASEEIPCFCRSWRFITLFTTAHHWKLSWARWIQSKTSDPLSLRIYFIIIFTSTLRYPKRSLSVSFLKFFIFLMRATCQIPLIYLDFITLTILGKNQKF